MKGHRWVAWDAYFFHKPFGKGLVQRFGPVGVVVFLQFVCACKDGRPPGTFTYAGGDPGGLAALGLSALDLVDSGGEPWTLEELWAFTGVHHTTKRRRRGDVLTVIARHWDDWQKERDRFLNAERQRRWRDKNERYGDVTEGVTAPLRTRLPTSTSTSTFRDFVENGKNPEDELVDLRAAVAVLKEQMGWGQHG